MTTITFKAHDAKQVSILGNKPLAMTWGKRGISWNALQMWNASVVLFEPIQEEMDVRTINAFLYNADYNIKITNRNKWIKQILDAHIKGSGFRAFQHGDSTSWPKISRGEMKTITLEELTNVLLEHREAVRAWKNKRNRGRAETTPEVETPEVTPEVTPEPLQNEDVPDSWDM